MEHFLTKSYKTFYLLLVGVCIRNTSNNYLGIIPKDKEDNFYLFEIEPYLIRFSPSFVISKSLDGTTELYLNFIF